MLWTDSPLLYSRRQLFPPCMGNYLIIQKPIISINSLPVLRETAPCIFTSLSNVSHSLPVSSTGSWGFISCSATSATTTAAAAAASGGGCGGEGGALTGVVDSGVSKASSESELLGRIKAETGKHSEDSRLQVRLGRAGLPELVAQSSALRLPLHFPKEIWHASMVSRAGCHGCGLLPRQVFMSFVLQEWTHTWKLILCSVRVAQPQRPTPLCYSFAQAHLN